MCIDENLSSEESAEEEIGIDFERLPFLDDISLVSEDAEIAYYRARCSEINKTPLFNIHRESAFITEQVTDLQMRMRGIRETYLKIAKSNN
ncbi:unnamed protein product [Blepharisma stoltei]|uniref:Uncharacterized protein n=1 Tax=Blepharisma stoltei TaxID=1481888 RepID=A0AAU9JUK6_9CILI|nr:unnamed protein product [Blepharisma stoltei]